MTDKADIVQAFTIRYVAATENGTTLGEAFPECANDPEVSATLQSILDVMRDAYLSGEDPEAIAGNALVFTMALGMAFGASNAFETMAGISGNLPDFPPECE